MEMFENAFCGAGFVYVYNIGEIMTSSSQFVHAHWCFV